MPRIYATPYRVIMSKESLYNDYIDRNLPSIFLAGPTSRTEGYDKSWRKEVVDYLKREKDFKGIIYVPENRKGPFDDSEEGLKEQHWWEWKAIDAADRVLFWIPRDVEGGMPAFTTNVEFGRYIEKCPDKVWLGYPENAEKMDYLKHLYNVKNPERPIYYNLAEFVDAVYDSFKLYK